VDWISVSLKPRARRNTNLNPISIDGGNIEAVSSFRYLSSVVECHGGVNEEFTVRMSHAAAVLHRSVFSDGSLPILTNSIVHKAVVPGVFLYAVETWLSRGNCIH